MHQPITEDISRLVTGLIKGQTTAPRTRTKVMPVKPFMGFIFWMARQLEAGVRVIKTKNLVTVSLISNVKTV